jgi:magnesium transporter
MLSVQNDVSEEIILSITRFQETTMMLRENIIDKQRVVSAMLKSDHFPKECYDRLRIIIKDINSLLEHTTFSFERLEYLQNTFLGLINIEQNKIIKIFTVASVVFMPPTLIASLYGMNFKFMPELNWHYGYPVAIGLMLLSSVSTLWLFRKKRWI